MALKFKGFKKALFNRPLPTLRQLALMMVLLIIAVSLVAFNSIRNFKRLEIDGIVTNFVEVSEFHAMPKLTIESDTGERWVLHNKIFKEVDVKLGYSFTKSRGSTFGYINGNMINLGKRK